MAPPIGRMTKARAQIESPHPFFGMVPCVELTAERMRRPYHQS
jgi:hypothetical protein